MFSLVTACMNRDAHLRRTLPEWLKLPDLAEVVVVDWTNATPLLGLTALDPRVRVVRVEAEPRWILSYAYNLGFAHATHEKIVKCDADCLPAPDIATLEPDAHGFFAGHWKTGQAAGKPSVNGQCVLLRSQIERVNGYSEFIRTYGRDDEDFYDRLQAASFARREITPAQLDFLHHTEEERVQNQFRPATPADIEARIARLPAFNEMRNAYLAVKLPWGPHQPRAAYDTLATGERHVVLRRRADQELVVPPALLDEARLYSLRYLVGRTLNLPRPTIDKLNADACLRLLAPRLAAAA